MYPRQTLPAYTRLSNIDRLKQTLRENLGRTRGREFAYFAPYLWSPHPDSQRRLTTINPFRLALDAIDNIEQSNATLKRRGDGGDWTQQAVIYNMFVRTTCAFDHDQNGVLDLPTNSNGFRETGTFLKAIVMLPYIQRLGANTIHLLPITSIGEDGKKGTLGSPYAIKNPYKLDENLSEPAIGLGSDAEFAAFVELAHRLGIRVVVEFVFRTASKDGDWILEHPEWFYWIRADIDDRELASTDESKYGAPVFTPDELRQITQAVEQKRFDTLLPPHEIYRAMFTPPPRPENIRRENSRLIGYLDDGTRVRIPGAFADWPPNDSQPAWGDVTYLKLYDHPDFNYMSYNTVRMYDARLAQDQNANYSLWEKIIGIIPHYQEAFNIDGVMIDMGHALPMQLKRAIVEKARSINPGFAFWDENFSVTPQSREEGYNAVIGYCWADHHDLGRFKALLRRCSSEGFAIPFFATPESHNTPRAAARPGGVLYSRAAWFVDNFMPAIPFLHSGFELGEQQPINTGLDFKKDELLLYPPESLPLFSEFAYNWLRDEQFTDWAIRISHLRAKFAETVLNFHPSTMRVVDTHNESIIAFARLLANGSLQLLVVANFDFKNSQAGSISVGVPSALFTDLLTDRNLEARDGKLMLHLAPGGCLLLHPHLRFRTRILILS